MRCNLLFVKHLIVPFNQKKCFWCFNIKNSWTLFFEIVRHQPPKKTQHRKIVRRWQQIAGGVGSTAVAVAAVVAAGHIRNGIMPHLWGINLSHIYAREVRWYFEFNSWYSSKICSRLSKKTWHILHLFFFFMSTLKGDVRVNIF